MLRLAETDSFSLRKLAARVQREHDHELACALMLYAHENGQIKRLLSYVYDKKLEEEYQSVEKRLGPRSIERLALRGTPMMSLPDNYRMLLESYVEAYYKPERIAEEKRTLWERIHHAVLISGDSPTELSRALGLDSANLSAYLAQADINRFTLDTARQIAEYVSPAA